MAKLIILPAVAMGLTALYLLTKNRHVEFETEMKMEPHEPPGGGTLMEAGIE